MSELGFWSNDWMDVQRKYWENWTDMSRKAMGLKEPAKNPWQNAMEHWWQAISPAAPDPAQEFMRRMMGQGTAFFRMTDEFIKNLPESGGAADWHGGLEKAFSKMRGAFSTAVPFGESADMQRMMAFWEMPLDNWQRMISSLSLVPGDLLRNLPRDGPKDTMEAFLSAPGLGYTREEQTQHQEMMRAALKYQQALQEYIQFFSSLGVHSVDRMRQKLEGLGEQDKTIDSARALYDLWVVSCEEVYGEHVTTPEYAKLHGNLVNALMLFKREAGYVVDEMLGAMNIPTSGELRALQDRMQETRRENKRLSADMEALKEQLTKMPLPPATAPQKKAAPKRKAAVRRKPPRT